MTSKAPDRWYCDSCGESITASKPLPAAPSHGSRPDYAAMVRWRSDPDGKDYDFTIVHQNRDGRSCDQDPRKDLLWMHLDSFLGPDGLAKLLDELSYGPLWKPSSEGSSTCRRVLNIEEFVDVFRRLQVPYYEEARRHFHCPAVRESHFDVGAGGLYTEDVLEHIATLCVDCEVGSRVAPQAVAAVAGR